MQTIEVSTAAPAIPREGDLKDAPQAARDELIALRNDVNRIGGTPTQLDAAITSGSRAEVVRALQQLQIRTEFGHLRKRIEEARVNVSSGSVTGAMDQAIVYGEQTARYVGQNFLPNWLKFGAVSAGATWLASRIAWIPVRLLGGKEAAASVAKWGNRAALAVGTVGALAKGTTDVVTSRTSTMDSIVRQIPGAPVFTNFENASIDLNAREKRVVDILSRTEWQKPLTNNRLIVPSLNLTDLPVDLVRIVSYAGTASQGTNDLTESNTDPNFRISRSADHTFTVPANVDKVEIQFRLTGETNMRPTRPITIEKR